MSLRSLRPYKPQGNSDATSSSNQLFTSRISTSSHPRAPQNEVQTPARSTKKRREPKHIVRNACLNCKRRRAKCDGKEPCGKCIEKPPQQECCYQPHIKYIKMELVESLRSLDSWKRNAERIFHAIEANENTSAIIERIQNHESVESIAQWLQETNGDFEGPSPKDSSPSRGNITIYPGLSDHQAIDAAMGPARGIPTSQFTNLRLEEAQGLISAVQQAEDQTPLSSLLGVDNITDSMAGTNDNLMSWTPSTVLIPITLSQYPAMGHWREQTTDHSTLDSTVLCTRDQGQAAILGHESGGDHSDHKSLGPLSWTNVTPDRDLVDHLIALYFCWEYPTFASLSKEHFLEAYKTGDRNYCSELLVNAIQAVGCRFSSQAGAQADPNDSNTAGDHFFAEAERLLFEEKDHRSLTTIQALGLMAIREASSGHSSQSIFFSGQSMRLAIEMGLHLNAEGQQIPKQTEGMQEVRLCTFWGAFTLNQVWSLTQGRLPQFSQLTKLTMKPIIIDALESSSWVLYTDDGALLERTYTQPSNIRSVYKTFSELSEIIHKSSYLVHTLGSIFTSQNLLDIYNQYLQWYDSIPAALRLGQNFTPYVLFCHIYYHYTILIFFRPFIKLTLIGSAILPRDVCDEAADAISALVKSYSQLYTLRRTPSFVPYFVLTAGITHLIAYGNTSIGPEKFLRGISDLTEMSGCHGFASRARNILLYLAKKWKIPLPEDSDLIAEADLDTWCRPSSISYNQFCPNIETVDMMKGIGTVPEDENPLFWLFPIQEQPLLAYRVDELKKNGFSLLQN